MKSKNLFLKTVFLIGAVLLMVCGHSLAKTDDFSSQAEVRKILTDLESAMRKIENMQTRFSQKKQLSLFQHEVQLQGTISMQKPDLFAWHTESPVNYSIILKKDKIYQWDEDTDHIQTLTLSDSPVLKMVIEQMQIWFYGSYVALLKQYDVRVLSKMPLALEFIPHKDILSASVIKTIKIQFQADQSYIESILIEETSGDQSILSFTDTVLNAGINSAVWRVNKRGV